MYIEQEHIGKTVSRIGHVTLDKIKGQVRELKGENFFLVGDHRPYSRSDNFGTWSVVEPKKKPSEVLLDAIDATGVSGWGNIKAKDQAWAVAVGKALDILLGDK